MIIIRGVLAWKKILRKNLLKTIESRIISVENVSAAITYLAWSLAVIAFWVLGTVIYGKVPGKTFGIFAATYWTIVTALIIYSYVNVERNIVSFYTKVAKTYSEESARKIAEISNKVRKLIALEWIISFITGFLVAYILNYTGAVSFPTFFSIGYLSALSLGNFLMYFIHYFYYRVSDYIPVYVSSILFAALLAVFIVEEKVVIGYTLGSLVLAYEVAALLYLKRALKTYF